jgi:hypothetical protein
MNNTNPDNIVIKLHDTSEGLDGVCVVCGNGVYKTRADRTYVTIRYRPDQMATAYHVDCFELILTAMNTFKDFIIAAEIKPELMN